MGCMIKCMMNPMIGRKMMKEVLILIPAYNESESIEVVVNNIVNNYPQYDYVIVNDGSSDDTLKVCRKNGYNVIDFPINLGLECGVVAGMKYAYRKGYKYIIQFDADGQHLPEYIEPMYQKIEEGFDIVIASRFVTEKKPFTARMLGSRLISGAIKLTTGKRIKDPTSGMRMYNRRCMEAFSREINYGPEPDTISYLMKNGYQVEEVQAVMQERMAGSSYLTFAKSISYMMKMLTSIIVIQNFRRRTK